jgi:hypothetical protein
VLEPPDGTDTIAGLRLDVSPAAEETFVRLTVPLNPPRLATVMMEEDDPPWAIVKVDGLAPIVKSVKVKVAVAECTRVVLVPVTVRVNVPPGAALQETVAVPEPVTVLGVIAPQVRPAGTVSVRVTTPENPLIAVMVIVEVAD